MRNEIDARGLPGFESEALARKGIEKYEKFVIIISDQESRELVTRLAEGMGCRIAFERRGSELYLTITRPSGPVRDR